MNLGTFVVLLIVIAIIALAVRSLIKDRENGISSCGGSCGACASAGICRGAARRRRLKHRSHL